MSRTDWVIKVLEDSNRRSIGYANKAWIRENAMDMNIRVCEKDCNVDLSGITEKIVKKDSLLIQEGKKIELTDFDPNEEALLLIKYYNIYYAFQYFPKD